MTAKDNNFIPPTEWLFAPKQPRSTKRRGDAGRGDAAPPAKRAKTEMNLINEEDRSMLLLRAALRYRHKWLQATRNSKATEHHKNEAKRLTIAANQERHARLEAYNEWRIQAHFSMTRLHYPLLIEHLRRLASAPSSPRHYRCKEYPYGKVVYSL